MAEAMNIEFSGVHHMALVCRDMEKTVDFYTRILGMKLVKAFDLGAGMGQHFFFDMGGDNLLAFFWFDGAPEAHRELPQQRTCWVQVVSIRHTAR